MTPLSATRYDVRTIALHWTVALLVVVQWASGHTVDWFAKGPPRVDARAVHVVLGSLLALALVWRIAWRAGGGTRLPRAPTIDATVSRAMHLTLYAVLISVVALGIFNEMLRGDDMFGFGHLPKWGLWDKETRHLLSNRVTTRHGLGATLILILAGLHASAALVHHYVLRDDVLQRMLPRH
jgi:cytochrome b561